MKTIAIITMHAVKNYGSVLQTLATQMIFELQGLKPVIIDYRRPWDTGVSYYFDLKNNNPTGIMKQGLYLPSRIKQEKVFGRFLSKYINLTESEYREIDDFKNNLCNADIYCTGSDQVWNSGWNRGIKEAFYLSFAPNNKKKVAYASSIGKDRFDEKEKEIVRRYLMSYDAISVRERSSVELLESIGIKNVQLVLDPTLQLPAAAWEKVVDTDTPIDNNYVLLIQLNRNKKFDSFAIDFAKQHNKKLLRLCLRVDQAVLPGKAIIIPEVLDYLRYIAGADYVLTDSFHAVSFCLNFGIDFYTILPDKYSTRIKSILDDLNLSDRIIRNYIINRSQNKEICYGDVNKRIEYLRSESNKYLETISSL